MMDDQTLVAQIMAGSMEAFRLLIKQNERLVSHMVGRVVKKKEEHEEVCQDVFLKVFDKIRDFGFESKLSTWIATIAYRHGLNYIRKNKMQFEEIPENDDYSRYFVSTENPADSVEEEDFDSYILQLVDKLPAQYKLVLTLYHLEGMNYEEIGKATGMPEGTVKNYLFRSRQMLKEMVMKKMEYEKT